MLQPLVRNRKHRNMKKILAFIAFALGSSLASAAPDVELGPNKGRIVELSSDKSLRAEVTLKEGKLHVGLLDKDKKPVELGDKVLTVSAGTREKADKVEVTKAEKTFSFPEVEKGKWLIIQIKENADAKPFTARVQYNDHFFEAHAH